MGADYSSQSAAISYYEIEFPLADARVEFHFSIVQALRNRTVSGTWGLLLGRRGISGGQWVVEALESMPAGSPIASAAAFQRWKPGPDKRISAVGYYRKAGHSKGSIDKSDHATVRQMFSQSALVLLAAEGAEPARLFHVGDEEGEPEWVNLDAPRLSSEAPELARPDYPIGTDEAVASFPGVNGEVKRAQAPTGWPARGISGALRNWRRPGTLVAAAAILGAGVIAMPRVTPITQPAAATRSKSILGLSAERHSNDLKVSWNRQAPAIRDAVSGTLVLQEQGLQPRELMLDQQQIRSSTILYVPVSGQVKIQLTVLGRNGQSSEAVIVNLPKDSPLQLRMTEHLGSLLRGK